VNLNPSTLSSKQPKNPSGELFGLNVKASKRPLKAGIKESRALLGIDYEGLEKNGFSGTPKRAFAQSIELKNARLPVGEMTHPNSGR